MYQCTLCVSIIRKTFSMNKMFDFTTLVFTTECNLDEENQTSQNNELSQQMLLSLNESGQYLIRHIMFSC